MVEERQPEPRWVPVADAARVLGVTENAVRRRIGAGTIPSRREVVGNRSRTLVRVDSPPHAEPDLSTVATLTEQVRHMEVQLARLEERSASSEAVRERVERDNTDLRAERDKLLAMLDAVLAEHRARRPWPGLRRWWRRFVEGEG